MAQETIDNHLITQFSDMMHVKAQQAKARLRPYVEIQKMTGDVYAYDGLGDVEARELTSRFSQTVFDEIEHSRRKVTRRRFSVTLPIDTNDLAGRLKDPSGKYAEACVRAMERVFDRVVYEAMFADVLTGRDFTTTVTAATDGVLTVNATAGLTYAKMLEIVANFIDNDVNTDDSHQEGDQGFVIGITGDEHTKLMQETQLISGDYTRQYSVERGQMQQAVGMDVLKFAANARKPVIPASGGTRTCFAMKKGAMFVGLNRDWEITLKDRPDMVDTKQIQIVGTLGAVRTEGKLIQKVTCTDT